MVTKKSWIAKVVESDPVVVRGVIVSIFGFIAMVLNIKFADGQVEAVVNGAISLLAIVSAFWSRGKVIPAKHVVQYLPSPNTKPDLVVQGKAEWFVTPGDDSKQQS